MRQAEPASALQRPGQLTTAPENELQAFSQALVNKLLHTPTCRLNPRNSGHGQEEDLTLASDLFGAAAGG